MVVVLDSLGREWFDLHRAGGRWPNLAAAADEWVRLDVTSNGEALHGAIWPTFATGAHEGKHGRYFAIQWIAGEMKLVFCEDPRLAVDPFWAALPPSLRATIVDVPYVLPVERSGFRTLLGWGLHVDATSRSSPDSFGQEVRRQFGRHPLTADTVEPASPRDKLRLTRDLRRGMHMRSRLVLDLAARRDWDLLVVNFDEPHAAGHYLAFDEVLSPRLTSGEAYREVVRPFDSILPSIVRAAGEDCHVFVTSLHGMRPQAEYSKLANQVVRLVAAPPAPPDLVRRVRGFLPARLHRELWRRLPPAMRAKRVAAGLTRGSYQAGAPMFTVPGEAWAHVRLNLRGRERDGVVEPDEMRAWLDRLERILPEFTADDGQAAFSGLWRRELEVTGPLAHQLPDALIRANPAVARTSTLRRSDGTILTATDAEARNGIHTGEAFCLWRPAPGAVPTRRDIHIVDLAATALQLLGVVPPASLDGRAFSRQERP